MSAVMSTVCHSFQTVVPQSHINNTSNNTYVFTMSVSVTETITMETRLTLESSPVTESTQSRSPEFDQKIAELEDWLTLLNHMLRSSRVMVADIADIEETSFKHKVGVPQ